MNKTEHLLVILSEECSEVIKDVSKALRFGLEDIGPDDNITNRKKIANEFNDLFAVMIMLKEHGVFEEKELITQESIENKKLKVEKYMKYAQTTGALTPNLKEM